MTTYQVNNLDISVDQYSAYNDHNVCDDIYNYRELSNLQIPDEKYLLTIFHTNQGYCGGYIISQDEDTYKVLLIRNEYGEQLYEISTISSTSQVFPVRKTLNTVFIRASSNISADGYIKAGEDISIGFGIGSGIINVHSFSSNYKKKLVKFPIYQPLTLHDLHHRNTLTYASSFILQFINQYIRNGEISTKLLEKACWLVNVVLLIDNYPIIDQNVFLEALTNFCLDYLTFSVGSLIRQPINYVLDILGIDGIYSKDYPSICYIPTDFKGVTYRSND